MKCYVKIYAGQNRVAKNVDKKLLQVAERAFDCYYCGGDLNSSGLFAYLPSQPAREDNK